MLPLDPKVIGIAAGPAASRSVYVITGILVGLGLRYSVAYVKTFIGTFRKRSMYSRHGHMWRQENWHRLAGFAVVAIVVEVMVGVGVLAVGLGKLIPSDLLLAALGAMTLFSALAGEGGEEVPAPGFEVRERDRWIVNTGDGFLAGLGLGLGWIPGVPPTGAALLFLLTRNIAPGEAAWLAFYLGAPAILAEMVVKGFFTGKPLPSVPQLMANPYPLGAAVVGSILAAVITVLVLRPMGKVAARFLVGLAALGTGVLCSGLIRI